MKTSTILSFGLLIMATSLLAQDTETLSSDQKKEYNRRKLTVEKVSESSGGMGWSWAFFSKRVDTWRAFRGLGNKIEAEEFFRLTGYIEEANEVKARVEQAKNKMVGGGILYVVGMVAMSVPKTETVDLGYGISYDEYSYPLLWPGFAAAMGGIYLWYDGKLKMLQPVAPFQTASEISIEYNRILIEEITR